MRLTRRHALAALAGIGVGSAALDGTAGDSPPATVTRILLAVAPLVYPDDVDVDASFIETYVLGRSHAVSTYERRVKHATSELDQQARRDYRQSFAALDRESRRSALSRLGVDRVHATPDGTRAQQIRYYVVNELRYALYSTPLGGRRHGVENPPGFPGGTEAYQQGPRR